jgi:hypothetical protein
MRLKIEEDKILLVQRNQKLTEVLSQMEINKKDHLNELEAFKKEH